MGIFGGTVRWRRVKSLTGLVLAAALIGELAGCAGHDAGELMLDPGRYDIFKCDDLAKRWTVVTAEEKELRGLMDRAAQSNGGALVGSLTYRAKYDEAISDEHFLQRMAAEKNCNLPFQAQSVQGAPTTVGTIPAASMQSGQPQVQNSPVQSNQVQNSQSPNPSYTSDQSIR
jgi:hypothetical protein